MALPLGIDVSRHQGVINWDAVFLNEPAIEFVIMRDGISYGYIDTYWERNWKETQGKFYRGAYHVIYPGQGAEKQCENLFKAFKLVNDDYGELPISLDYERDFNQSPTVITKELLAISKIIETETQKRPIIYTRKNWADMYFTKDAWRKDFIWWIALYLNSGQEHPGIPTPPIGVDQESIYIHQTSQTGSVSGIARVDLNRWQYPIDHLVEFVKGEQKKDIDYWLDVILEAEKNIRILSKR